MMTLTATLFVLSTFITLCTSARIGLPEDKEDVSSCFDRSCISEKDWYKIGQKWKIFRDEVKMMNDSMAADIRQSIWHVFRDGDIWNGDDAQIDKHMEEIRNLRRSLDKRTEDIQARQPKHKTTRYDHQAIVMMERDMTVQKAAHFLYNKHPTVSTLYEYNSDTDTLKVVAGKEHYLGHHSRVQIVGHGSDTKGVMRLAEKSPHELAEIVRKLPIKKFELGRVSLVGCNVGSGWQSEYLSDGFTEKFLKNLISDQQIHTEVSSRNGLVRITASGKKETGVIFADRIQWFSKYPLSKTVIKLGKHGEVIRAELPITERIDAFNQESSEALVHLQKELKDINNDNSKPIYIEKKRKDGNREVVKMIEKADIDKCIRFITNTIFLNEIDFVKRELIDRNVNLIKEKIQSVHPTENVPSIEVITKDIEKKSIWQEQEQNTEKINHHQFIGKTYLQEKENQKVRSDTFSFIINIDEAGNLKMELFSTNNKIEPFALDSGIPRNWKYVARMKEAKTFPVINVEDVRSINSRADLIYEINMLGTFGVDLRNNGKLYRYYRFGDMVYRMTRSNFYIRWEGMIASDAEVEEKHKGVEQVKEIEIKELKKWIWLDRNNNYDLPEHRELEKYPDMEKQLNMDKADNPGKFFKLMSYFKDGEHNKIVEENIHILEGSVVLAVGVSEPVRNFRTYVVNEMLTHLNTIEKISVEQLIKVHPMTRGRSWGRLDFTGLTVNINGYQHNQKRNVLPRELNIAKRFLLSRRGKDNQNNRYKFLTECEYNEATADDENLHTITSQIKENDIESTIAGLFNPEVIEGEITTEPLGSFEIQRLIDLEVHSDISSDKAMPIRASVSLVNDYIVVTNHVSKTIAKKSQDTGREYEIIKNSVEVEKGRVKFTVREKTNPLAQEEININIDENLLNTKKIKEEAFRKLPDLQKSIHIPSKSLNAVNVFLGVYGIVMGFRAAVQDFEDGKAFDGIVNAAQSVHGIYGMSETAQRVSQKISSKLFSNGLKEAETDLSVASAEMKTALTEGTTATEESLMVVGNAAEDIPILGTVFGLYNTVQDIRRETAIGYIDAGLDAATTILAFLGPEAMGVSFALTIVRLVIDDFYCSISNELKNLPPDATVLQRVVAVFKGIGESIVMVLKELGDFLTLGCLSFAQTSRSIDMQYRKDQQLLKKMSDFHNYFKIEKEGSSHEKLIDFAAGEESWDGGNILFNLYDDNTARLQMQIVDANGRKQTLDKTISLEEGANDIVLGIGESHDICFKKQSAKLFWFIPVHSKYIISKVRGERNTLHGTYYGNSKPNKFFTVQTLPENADLGYSLADYFYEIYGEDGDDIFYLGPQKSVVNGGNGRDIYVVPNSGGMAEINNYATDLKEDVLFIQVKFEDINVDRIENDLILKYGHEHHVTVQKWFSGHRMGHLTFRANYGVIFNVTIGSYGQASIVPLAVISAGDTKGDTIDVSRGIWKNVIMITGSDASDVIVANDNNNLLNGGKGNNTLYGGIGNDIYIIDTIANNETSDWNVINNFDSKMAVDTVIFDVPYEQINVNKTSTDIQLYTNSMNGPKVIVKSWFSSEHYRHMMFVTNDDVIFELANDTNDRVLPRPVILDASKEPNGVTLNANESNFAKVSTFIGSDYNDVIIGSKSNDYIKAGKGNDTVTGGEGKDVYVIQLEDVGDFINNFAEDEKDDMLLVGFNYNDISIFPENSDAVLSALGVRIVTIINWMIANSWRHILIRTIDGTSFKLEKNTNASIQMLPIVIDKSAQNQSQKVIANQTVEYITGSNFTDYLIGNELANTIDPGFGGAYMMGLEGHDQYTINDHYIGPNVVNNNASDNLTDTVKLPAFFKDVVANLSENDIILTSSTNPSATVKLEQYKTDPYRRHIVVNTVKDGIVFTMSPSRTFKPTAISIDRTNLAQNLIVDLSSYDTWKYVITVAGSRGQSNAVRGNQNNNTITGGTRSDTLGGAEGNDVIRGNQGDDFIDGEDGDDILVGGAGEDWIDGGMGDDVIYPGPDYDYVKGGPGFDVIIVFGDANNMSGVFVDLLNGHGYGGDAHGDIYVSVEGVIGGFFNDLLIGNHYNNYLDGKEGNDILFPLNGTDLLVGGEGKDMYDIGDSTGEKMIRNYAKDGVMDYVNLKVHEKNKIYLERRRDDIIIHVGEVLKEGVFCPRLDIGPYHIKKWYKNVTYQHLIVQLADENVVLDNFFTGNLEAQLERPDTNDRKEKCAQLMEVDSWGNFSAIAIPVLCLLFAIYFLIFRK